MMGFTDTAPAVTCSQVSIDPPIGVQVHFVGDIGTHKGVDLVAPYVGADHMAKVDVSSFTTAAGPISYALVAHASFGPYGVHWSLVATGVLDCHDAPTTTTSVAVSPSTAQSTTSIEIGTPIVAALPAHALVVPAKELPFTGTATGPLAGVGIGLVALGVFLARKFRSVA